MTCRTGCPTQDHGSWGECARASNLQFSDGEVRAYVKWNEGEVTEYAKAVAQGIQPESTREESVRKAVAAAERTGNANGYTDNQLAIHREAFGCDPE